MIEHLRAAELRHDLAPGLLTEIAANPAAATSDERAAVAARLQEIAEQAADTVHQIAADASRTIADQHDLAGCEAAVDVARTRVAEAVTTVNAGDATDVDPVARREWLAAIENLLPATLAADRAAAAVRTRTDNTEHRTIARRRHPNLQNLLRPDDGADPRNH